MQYLKENGLKKINYTSQIYEIEKFEENEIYIMRDDLIPFSFGGNKARKAYNFFNKILTERYNFVITYGSASSNHCRIIANLAKKSNIGCTIISTEKEHETNNKLMCEMFGAEFIYCKVEEVKNTIEEQMKQKKELNYKPYFIQGGGHGSLGTQAYIDAYSEIIEFQQVNNIKFDYIFHASGTGTTQAGLNLGKMINDSKASIVGISIARKLPRGRQVVVESIKEYMSENSINKEFKDKEVEFVDDYILEGYGKYNKEILKVIEEVMCKHRNTNGYNIYRKSILGNERIYKKKRVEK